MAGAAGSVSLAVPRSGTRPTSDRVREAVFSALDSADRLHGTAVLDLYAGSGALGLEAASRGASSVVLVERAAAAAGVCRRNAAAVLRAAPGAHIRVAAAPVASFLASGVPEAPFDLVFLDPPYDLAEGELAAALAALNPLLVDDAWVVVERSTRSPEPGWPEGLRPIRSRRYGETTVWFARGITPATRTGPSPTPDTGDRLR